MVEGFHEPVHGRLSTHKTGVAVLQLRAILDACIVKPGGSAADLAATGVKSDSHPPARPRCRPSTTLLGRMMAETHFAPELADKSPQPPTIHQPLRSPEI